MKIMQATEAKNRFGELLELSATEPVLIQKNGRELAVVVSKAEYERLAAGLAKRELVKRYHEESIKAFEPLYKALAK